MAAPTSSTPSSLSCTAAGPSLAMDKQALRADIRAQRKALSTAKRDSLSLVAQQHILESAVWKKARCVALYMALPEETDAAALVHDAWASGKTTLLPLCSLEQKGYMELHACTGLHELRPGPFGILEPDPEVLARSHDSLTASGSATHFPAPDLIIMPGVAFDFQGHRLGMGGGYYDRLLAQPKYAQALRIGLAFDFQLVTALPGEAWDLPVHACSTEKGLVWIQRP